MKKYNKKLLWDYINGNYIENIEELENDYDFMIEVINITRDIKMINLCSKRLMQDHRFITFLLTAFKNNEQLLKQIEKDYIEKLDKTNPKYIELVFLLSSLEDKYNPDSIYLKYLIERQAIYLTSRIEYEKIKEHNQEVIKKYGLGFSLIKLEIINKYNYNKLIIDYYAKKLIEEIFTENKNYNFEEIVHIRYKEPSKIKEIGIRNFIIDYIYVYDKYLSNYVAANISLINDIEKKLQNIIDNYKEYNYNILETKNAIFEEKAKEIIYNSPCYLTLEEICLYLYKKKKLKIPYLDDDFYESNDLYILEDYDLSFVNKKYIKEIYLIAQEIYDKNTTITKLNMMEEYKYIEEKCESKVLEFKPNKSIGNS